MGLFGRERADLQAGQDPGRILNVLLDGEPGNVYDNGERPWPLVFMQISGYQGPSLEFKP